MAKTNTIITIGREYGSAGRQIGYKVAEDLGIKLYDREMLERAAKESGICEELFETHDEKPTNSFLYSLVMDTYSFGYSSAGFSDMPMNHKIFLAQFDAIKKLADEGSCVFIGRCADYVLREMNPFRIFVYADTESKLKRCMERSEPGEHLTEKELRKKMKDVDRSRAQYCEFCSQQKWGDKSYYDLLINTSGKNIKQLSNSLYEYLK